jgi:hypothetical protein
VVFAAVACRRRTFACRYGTVAFFVGGAAQAQGLVLAMVVAGVHADAWAQRDGGRFSRSKEGWVGSSIPYSYAISPFGQKVIPNVTGTAMNDGPCDRAKCRRASAYAPIPVSGIVRPVPTLKPALFPLSDQ